MSVTAVGPVGARGAVGGEVGRPGALSLAVLLAATFMTSLDVFIVNVAIPAVQSDLRASTAAMQWVVAGFGLALAACLVTAGRLGDMVGRRRVFAMGLALFTLTSVACGVAPSAGTLIAARVAQGAAAALMGPQVLAILRTAYSGAAQARAFSAYGLVMGVGAVFGQLIGGALIKADVFGLDWRACFLINLPVGAVTLPLVPRALAESRAAGRPRLDLTGATLSALGLAALVLPLIQGRAQGWPGWTWACLAASVVLFAVFGVHQKRLAARGGDPVVDLAVFKGGPAAAGFLAQLVFWSGQGSFFLVLALYLQQGRGLTPLASGVVFLAIGVSYLLTSTTAHRFAARLGSRTVPAGALVMAAGLALLWVTAARLGADGSVWWLAVGLFVDGLGMGMVIAPLTSQVLERVSAPLVGSASGVIATLQQVGGALGVALIGIVFYAGLGAPVGGDAGRSAFGHAFGCAMAALTALEVVLALLMPLTTRRVPVLVTADAV
ncbi:MULTISPECIES: MFS transporter [Streptomycetaceae]|uniref:Major facilitator superfamily MFS_1 n=1 Tax=Streptantibioticus cattleyicolor (strain ATCC 35852 / DSM 46488 / JCM 4925 / NBRC 14057 / NRRL 8057) TaxID=1003195 RepID=F8K0R3_STREN|nr:MULTISPECIES: MFS transporter [Streptomycetaceae]AEW94827.1 major facilitator superfamily MFS_1 [Streptantibioticus cattleyicolor NRRL 8057 = DSM 46488]MYS59448.1 MFS transporter [Streptomyces sp. SID5468]CCB75183.1 Arabinose efflux permease family protein [Streptantibioticus cattleyicolor NRRL 8057 = DSM 46488]